MKNKQINSWRDQMYMANIYLETCFTLAIIRNNVK